MSHALTLIGMMGAGKTTVAGVLAFRRGWRAVDLDDVIVERAGQPISAIFAEQGEAGFRALEREALVETLRSDQPIVLAAGGGTPAQPGLMQAIVEAGPTFWLRCSPQLLARRAMAQGLASRPLLANCVDEAAVASVLAELHDRRAVFYGQAHAVVDIRDGDSPEDIADRIEALEATL